MKYDIVLTSAFKNSLKTIKKRRKDLDKLTIVVNMLANGEQLDAKYHDHELNDNKHFKNCRELHLEPNWLLVYKINKKDLILFLMETGTHSDLFNM
jgi:mRNA interferase YafQ